MNDENKTEAGKEAEADQVNDENETKADDETKTDDETKADDEAKADDETKTDDETKADDEAKADDETKAGSENETGAGKESARVTRETNSSVSRTNRATSNRVVERVATRSVRGGAQELPVPQKQLRERLTKATARINDKNIPARPSLNTRGSSDKNTHHLMSRLLDKQ